VKENDSHGYSDLYLSGEAARLAPEGLLGRRNNVPGWKAVIRQLEDQLAAGPPETQQAAADQAEGLMGFANRMLKTPYATTPMRPTRRRQRDEVGDDDEVSVEGGGSGLNEDVLALLQRLEDSIGHMRGELGVWSSEARYLTLHGGMVTLGEDHTNLHQEVLALSNKLKATEQQADGSRAALHQVRAATSSLGAEVAHLARARGHGGDVEALRREVQGLKTERADLESTVLALTNAVTGLMEVASNGPSPSPDHGYLEARFTAYDAAIKGRLDSLRQEMKGGGITVGGVVFSGREAAMDWARIHLPPNTYQCIGGMVYAMCLISEAVVHQEDMMKREEHGERVKRTPMQSAQVLSVHTSYPPVLDGAKSVQRDAKYDFLALKTYKQWKPVDGEGTYKMLKEGVERSFELIKNAIDSTFGMKPQARAVLLDLLTEFKMMYHELFIMEVNLFYEETLNKVGGEHPSDVSRVECWALVTKLLRTVFKATHGARSFATEAGGPGMDPLQTNGYFLYAALEELRVLKEFSKVKWRRHEEFGHTMLGFVFENSVLKAVLDARPNPVLKLNGVDEQLKVFRATVDHIQTNLAQIRAHANMAAMKPVGKKAKGGAVAEIE
jgi:predicted  nucleic acid-binding Zn-ribbon protein